MRNPFDNAINPARFVTHLILDARDVVLGAACLGVMRCVWRYQRTQYDAAQTVREAPRGTRRDSFITVARELT